MDVDYDSLPRVPLEAVLLLWILGDNDEVLSGMLVLDNKLHYYELCDYAVGANAEEVRRYVIRQLTAEQSADEQTWIPLFEEHVGSHFGDAAPRPIDEWQQFYRPYGDRRPHRDYTDRPIIGWLEM